jgi:predicted transglutaminase-like cysteine proteinase
MFRMFRALAISIVLSAVFGLSYAHATFYGFPRGLSGSFEHVAFGAPTLAPMAHARFCLRYPTECRAHRIVFRPRPPALDAARWHDLTLVNRMVNRTIAPRHKPAGITGVGWVVAPKAGDCNDYAVTKRHELLARGWPARSLLLAEVVTNWGEHHLVLVVRTRDADLVLDNLTPEIRTWSKTSYEWVRIQSPANPQFWSSVRVAQS